MSGLMVAGLQQSLVPMLWRRATQELQLVESMIANTELLAEHDRRVSSFSNGKNGQDSGAIYVLSRLFAPFPLLQATRRRRDFSAAIPPTLLLSGDHVGARERGGSGNRFAGVVRLRRCLPRSRLCSPSTIDGGASVCRGESSPPRPRLLGSAGEAVATVSQGNKFLWSLPHPFGVCSWRQWRGQGRGDSPDPCSGVHGRRHIFLLR